MSSKSAVKKPMNSFFYYRREMKAKIEQEYQTSNSHEVSRICSALWANESADVKEQYRQRSIEAHNQHKIDYPEFDWNPHKNIKKIQKRRNSSVSISKRRDSVASYISIDNDPSVDARRTSVTSIYDRRSSLISSPILFDNFMVSQDILEVTKLENEYNFLPSPARSLSPVSHYASPIASPASILSLPAEYPLTHNCNVYL
ncbi:hypothetical protein HDV01_006471 [Terramyces sp. JEL0728]|nr:hypothetical protein HDV01_006471 [Terramyces sp. JEL0728]